MSLPSTDRDGADGGHTGPDFSKVGFGALGNVHVEHKPTTIHNEVHVHHHAASHHTGSAPPMNGGVRARWPLMAIAGLLIAGAITFVKSRTFTVPSSTADAAPILSAPTREPAALEKAATKSAESNDTDLTIELDRPDHLYADGATQSIRVTVPVDGYLYVVSEWANGEMRLLSHPDWQKPQSGMVTSGQVVTIPFVRLAFTPVKADDNETEEKISAWLTRSPVSSIPATRTANIAPLWQAASAVHEREILLRHSVAYRILRARFDKSSGLAP